MQATTLEITLIFSHARSFIDITLSTLACRRTHALTDYIKLALINKPTLALICNHEGTDAGGLAGQHGGLNICTNPD
jgi:hypothetical protein